MSSVAPIENGQRPAESDHRWLILVIVGDCPAHGGAGRHRGEHRPAVGSGRPALPELRSAVGGDGVRVGVRQPAAGRRPVADMFSRKRIFIIGLIGFALASALGGAATSFGMLVTALGPAGRVWRHPRPLRPGYPGQHVPRPARARPGVRRLRLRGGGRRCRGPYSRRGPDAVLLLALVPVRQPDLRRHAVTGALVYMQTNRPDIRPRMDWAGAVLASAGLFLIVFGFSHAETAG